MNLSESLKNRLQRELSWVEEELQTSIASKERCQQMVADREAEIVKLNKDKLELEELLT